MRRLLLAVLGLVAAVAGAGTQPAQATWQDTAPVSGATITTVTPQAPVVRCHELALGGVTIEWDPVPHATGYLMTDTWGTWHYGPDETSQTYALVGGATLTVQTKYGPWLSDHSNEVTWGLVVIGGTDGCS